MRPAKHTTGIAAIACATVALAAIACSDSSSPNADPNGIAYSFAVLGCNRVDKADTSGDPSTANVAELNRTFADIAAISPKPAFLFFAGDEVLGYTSDTVALAAQLQAWRSIFESSPLASSGIELVAVPGNHEVQNANKIAYAAGERTWLRVMAPYIKHGGNGPAAGGADSLQTDQSNLTYSFDYKDAHFVTLNSDPVGDDWHVPVHWVQSDVNAAVSRGKKHVFAVAHKPAYPYPTVATDGLSAFPASRDAFWAALTGAHAEAMISAHNHVFYRAQPAGQKTWMIIAGNGGSKLETTIDPTIPGTGSYYGYALITVTNSGRVFMKSFGRDVPPSGYTATPASTTMRDSVEITWK